MREIDDRYPEFAEPNEPVKRGKRHGGLTWSFFTAACVFVLAVSFLNLPSAAPVIPDGPPDVPVVPEVQEPKTAAIVISVESREEEYSGEEFQIVPQFTYTASDEDGDATDAVTVELNEDTVIKATDAGEYPFDLDESSFNITAEGYDDYTVEIEDGALTINPADITVAVRGSTLSVTYDRRSHTVSGYSVTPDRSDYSPSNVSFTGSCTASRTAAGTSYMGLAEDQFTNNNDNYNVTFRITDGYVRVNRASVTVTVTGAKDSVTYDGSAHSVSGYTTSISNSNYSASLFTFSGSASASRTEVGTSYMGLKSSMFRNQDSNFSVTFSVTDGYIEITEPETDPDTPVIQLIDVEDNYNLDMVMFARVTASVMPNKASEVGGSIRATVHVKDGSGNFVEDTEYPYEYSGDGNNTEQEIDVVYRMDETVDLDRATGKLVVQYTYPDGTSDTWESEEFDMFKGSFAVLDYSYGDWGVLVSDHKIEVDLIFTENVEFPDGSSVTVDRNNIEIRFAEAYASVYDDSYEYVEDLSFSKEMPDETEFYTGTDGLLHWHLTYNFPDNVVPPAPYTVYSGFYAQLYDPDSGWDAAIWW